MQVQLTLYRNVSDDIHVFLIFYAQMIEITMKNNILAII